MMSPDDPIKDYVDERRLFANRTLVAAIVIATLIGILLVRVAWLQLFKHEYYTTRADDNRMHVEVAQPVRGLIYDRHGVLLADNLPSYRLEMVPEQVEDVAATLAELAKLVEIRDEDLERFHERYNKRKPFIAVPVRGLLNPEEVARFEINRQHFPGVNIIAGLTRHYPLGKTAAHLIGYVGIVTDEELKKVEEHRYRGTSYIGKSGVEKSYEDDLHGQPGYRVTEANAAGRLLRQLDYQPPIDGRNLHLNIDARVQIAAEQALGEEAGAIVAIDPRNGGVLALVSEPSFDPSLFIEGIDRKTYKSLVADRGRPLFNRALTGAYPPGSTIKPFMSLAGLEYRVTSPHEHRYCRGYHQLGGRGRRYRCWRGSGHGAVNMIYSIIQSCDVYYYQLGAAIGIDRMHDFLYKFGLGHATDIDLPGEKPGLLPSSEWKRRALKQKWYGGETLSVAIGQGYMNVTPLQMAHATARIAVKGRGAQPQVVRVIEDPISGKRKERAPEVLSPIRMREDALWKPAIDGMLGVVNSPNGTAHRISKEAAFTIAGKTGTAQVRNMTQAAYVKSEQMRKEDRDHAWFIAFAPADDPQIALVVLVENGGHGGSMAAPLARQVMDAYLAPRKVEVAAEP